MLILFLLIIGIEAAFAQDIFVEGGAGFFPGELGKEIGAFPSAGAGAELALSNSTRLYAQGAFSYLKPKRNKDFSGIYQFIGRAGIETPERLLGPAAIGLGVSLAAARGNGATPEAERYMLSTSESEFGWNARLELELLKAGSLALGARAYYDEIWTRPKSSRLLQFAVFCSLFMQSPR